MYKILIKSNIGIGTYDYEDIIRISNNYIMYIVYSILLHL